MKSNCILQIWFGQINDILKTHYAEAGASVSHGYEETNKREKSLLELGSSRFM
jgi:hypothetical protein